MIELAPWVVKGFRPEGDLPVACYDEDIAHGIVEALLSDGYETVALCKREGPAYRVVDTYVNA